MALGVTILPHFFWGGPKFTNPTSKANGEVNRCFERFSKSKFEAIKSAGLSQVCRLYSWFTKQKHKLYLFDGVRGSFFKTGWVMNHIWYVDFGITFLDVLDFMDRCPWMAFPCVWIIIIISPRKVVVFDPPKMTQIARTPPRTKQNSVGNPGDFGELGGPPLKTLPTWKSSALFITQEPASQMLFLRWRNNWNSSSIVPFHFYFKVWNISKPVQE